MSFDDERFDRARVGCLLLGEPEPPAPIPGAPYGYTFIAFGAVDAWLYCDRPGSLELPRDLAEEFAAYATLVGWHNDPHLVGLLNGLRNPGWSPETAVWSFDKNPYREPQNWNAFDNGKVLAKTPQGERYRKYIAACREKAAAFSEWIRIP